MCGIAGFAVGPGNADGAALRAMCDQLVHRGPDDSDRRTWDDHGVGLGHLRLSIIDPSPAGRNPMSNEDGTVWIVHNGEIYNHRALRSELERAGHRFSSDSDTEVIVHGYEEWGDSHVARLRGMFSYALYDRRGGSPRMLLVRDRFGVKPLHYSWDGDRLAFGSEPKALLELGWVDRCPIERPSRITSYMATCPRRSRRSPRSGRCVRARCSCSRTAPSERIDTGS